MQGGVEGADNADISRPQSSRFWGLLFLPPLFSLTLFYIKQYHSYVIMCNRNLILNGLPFGQAIRN